MKYLPKRQGLLPQFFKCFIPIIWSLVDSQNRSALDWERSTLGALFIKSIEVRSAISTQVGNLVPDIRPIM
jgi:hypothetical protein